MLLPNFWKLLALEANWTISYLPCTTFPPFLHTEYFRDLRPTDSFCANATRGVRHQIPPPPLLASRLRRPALLRILAPLRRPQPVRVLALVHDVL